MPHLLACVEGVLLADKRNNLRRCRRRNKPARLSNSDGKVTLALLAQPLSSNVSGPQVSSLRALRNFFEFFLFLW